jgi:glutaminyl-tRNA synthetase
MPTLNGLRRRGYSAKTLNTFCDVIGVARRGGEVWTAVNVLEQCCREELDAEAQRRFVVVDPVKVTLTNVAADFVERVMLPNNPRDESAGKRSVALCNTLYLERSDFREDGAEDRDFFGLAPGKTVMLRCVQPMLRCVSKCPAFDASSPPHHLHRAPVTTHLSLTVSRL